ncbi:MAG: 4-hydroxy-tetrahydrodipicolinate synthase [Thermoflexibacter sp.]|jgi:4-hydroxy-tetrahydrodipicolinate synthase|nr:4-hydroxy-tetrahydrodipicolinate synthase [Thermoflexibacter sp.]
MIHTNWKGVGVALVTPFDAEEAIDYHGLLKLLRHTEDYVDYWVVHGTTGEAVTTTTEEKAKILKFVKENNPKNVPIMYGLGGNNTRYLLEELTKIDFEGVGAILSVSPYYNKPPQKGIVKHYWTIADHSPVPVMLYNVPGRTSSNLSVETTLELSKHPNILGIKEASGNITQCMQIAKDKPKDFLLLSGDDILTVPSVSFGAVGVISVLANALPKEFCNMVHLAMKGDYENASILLYRFLALNDLMYAEGNPVGIKALLEIMGICGATVRTPMERASEGLVKKIERELKEFGI